MTSLILNGEPINYRLDPATPLLWALRDSSNLTGTKYGCDSKDCGACTVIVDGQAVLSCAVPLSQLEGAKVTTIEGLGGAGAAHPVQQAWLAEQVTMCGFCEPGFIMAVAALVDRGGASAAEFEALPNLCRCGAYPRIRKAIARAITATMKPSPTPENPERTASTQFTAG